MYKQTVKIILPCFYHFPFWSKYQIKWPGYINVNCMLLKKSLKIIVRGIVAEAAFKRSFGLICVRKCGIKTRIFFCVNAI